MEHLLKIITLIFVFYVALPTYAANLESTNYKIYGGQVNEIIGEPASTNYNLNSGGNPIEGDTSSANYKLQSGSALSFPGASSSPSPSPSPSPSLSSGSGANGPPDMPNLFVVSPGIPLLSPYLPPLHELLPNLPDDFLTPPTIPDYSIVTEADLAEFANLPSSLRLLTRKFPSLAGTFRSIGVKDFSDLDRLSRGTFILPGFDELDKIPTEVVFARSGDKLINFNTQLKIAKSGLVTQLIHVISGHPVNLAIRPNGQVKEITGYLVLRESNFSQDADDSENISIDVSSLTASLILAQAGQVKVDTGPKKIELEPDPNVNVSDEFLLNKFTYSDPDGDGIFTTTITAPFVASTYEVITNITYADGSTGSSGIRLILVVDPEGYVYTVKAGLEARVPDAVVTIFWRDPQANDGKGEYVPWPAREYSQRNPQVTEKAGEYSFLVPPGEYYLTVASAKYHPYTSEPFIVTEGSGVHMNIELAPVRSFGQILLWIGFFILFLLLLLILLFLIKRRKQNNYYQ
ncbi:MAG TPA: carboxypeptidase-like regulatory domain-containing protein [Candidatus Paceibacterota bacterium]